MPTFFRASLSASLVVSAIAACYPKPGEIPGPTGPADLAAANTRWPNTSADALAAGRTSFIEKCNGCHKYPDIQSVSEAKWPDVAASMGKKAGLDPTGTENLLHFVLVARARGA